MNYIRTVFMHHRKLQSIVSTYIAKHFCYLGVKITRGDNINQQSVLEDYSFINFNSSKVNEQVLFHCVSGLRPTVPGTNDKFGHLYFNNTLLDYNTCNGFVQAVEGSNIIRFPGVLNIRLCGERKLNTSTEGVYTCRLMNSSMMYQNMSIGVYFSGRSMLLYNIYCQFTILYSSASLLITSYSLSTMDVAVGSPLTLTCTSSGSPPDTFIWMKNGVPIAHSTSITAVNYTNTTAVFSTNYTISNFNTSDIGTYTCTVSNPIGSDSKIVIGKYMIWHCC